MPCSQIAGHHPIHGMGICPVGHINRFCAACYTNAQTASQICSKCSGALALTEDEREMHAHSQRVFDESRRGIPRAAASSSSSPVVISSASAAITPSTKMSTVSVDEDIAGKDWDALRLRQKKRLAVRDIQAYPPTSGKKFRKYYGIQYPREPGFTKEKRARRVAFRVTPDDGKAIHWQHAFPPLRLIAPVNRGDTVGTLQPAKFGVGYVAMIPLPVSLADAVGNDRHPLKVAEMYAKMFSTTDLAWRRLRVLFAVNLRDDYRHLGDTTADASVFLADYTTKLNAAFLAHDLPARAIGVLWGFQVVDSTAIKHGVAVKAGDPVIHLDTSAADLSTDELRLQLRAEASSGAETLKGTEFPFATFRSLLVQSSEATRMIAELKTWNEHVFLHTGDGDVVSLEPVKGKSLFAMFDSQFDQMKSATIAQTARLAGCTQFDDKEVRALIGLLGITDGNALALTKSVLLTLLAKTLDTCVRGVLDQTLPHAGYFAEPNTLLNSELIAKLELATISNESNGDMPDWASSICKLLVKANAAAPTWIDRIWPMLAFQLTTSARAALVVLSDDIVGADTETICIGAGKNEAFILSAFCGEHNTQLKSSQVKNRLEESTTYIPVTAPIGSVLPPQSAYALLPLAYRPGAALQAVWGKVQMDEVSAALRSGELIRGMLPRHGASAADIMDLIYSFPNQVDLIPRWGMVQDMRLRLSSNLRASAGYREGDEDFPVYDALLHIDAVLHWGIAMVSRVLALT